MEAEIITEVKKVPSLRFSEFEGDWISHKLKDLSTSIVSGKSKPDLEGKYFVFGSTGVIGKSDFYTHDGKYLLVARVGANAGQINIAQGKFCVTDNTLIIDIINDFDFNFIYYSILKYNLNKLIFGSGQPLITGGLLKQLNLHLPINKEQNKIASFLTAIDYKIKQLSKKKDLLGKYKKGVMQQIFSKQVSFRDKNGQDFPEWEVKKLGDLTKLFSKRNKNLIDAKVYSVTNTNGFVLQSDHFSKVVAGDDLSGYKIIKKHDFAYNPARINVGSIAHFKDEIGIISSLYVCFSTNHDLNDDFLSYTLQLDSTKYKINTFGEGGVRIYLWYPLLAMIKIQLPSLAEQEKIVEFLSAIDNKINLVTKQLEQTKQFKKGLLQQMFV